MTEKMWPASVLTVAGSDASGRAGLQADLRVFQAFGLHGLGVITAVTAQGAKGDLESWPVPLSGLESQLSVAFADHQVGALKAGMLVDGDRIGVLRRALTGQPDTPFVLDPVLATTAGARLLEPGGLEQLVEQLLPVTTVLTPNLPEAALLLGRDPQEVVHWDRGRREELAAALLEMGPAAVYLKGGHGEGLAVADLLLTADSATWLERERIESPHLRGTGCLLSAALCSGLALGNDVLEASVQAADFVAAALAGARGVGEGAGCPLVPASWPPAATPLSKPD